MKKTVILVVLVVSLLMSGCGETTEPEVMASYSILSRSDDSEVTYSIVFEEVSGCEALDVQVQARLWLNNVLIEDNLIAVDKIAANEKIEEIKAFSTAVSSTDEIKMELDDLSWSRPPSSSGVDSIVDDYSSLGPGEHCR